MKLKSSECLNYQSRHNLFQSLGRNKEKREVRMDIKSYYKIIVVDLVIAIKDSGINLTCHYVPEGDLPLIIPPL